MPYARGFAIAGLVLLLAPVRAVAQPPLHLQKTESHVDKNGCIHFAATAVVDAPIEDLFDALSTPEEKAPENSIVFVRAPITRAPFKGPWVIKSPPAGKIVGTYPLTERAWGPLGPPMTWVEYSFDRQHHTVYESIIGGSTGFLSSPTCIPPNRAKYLLSPAERGSATLVRYSKLECWSPDLRKKWPTFDQQQIQSDRRSLSSRLAVAQHYAQLIAKEHPERARPAQTSSSPARSGVAPTATPVAVAPRP
jgi:hypothetical protein